MNNKKRFLFPILAVVLSLMLTVIVAEIILQIVDPFTNQVSQEQVLDYKDTWLPNEEMGPGGFLQPDFDEYVIGGYGNLVKWVNNSDGFRNEEEFEQTPPADTIRILSLGDSFTAGYRVGQHEMFSWILEDNLNKQGLSKNVEVLVSCIEDPGYALYYLQNYGYKFKPDIVLLGITLANDITETYLRVDEQGTFTVKECGEYHCLDIREGHTTVEYWNDLSTTQLPDYALNGPVKYNHQSSGDSLLQYSAIFRLLDRFFSGQRILNEPAAIISGVYTEKAPLFDLSSGLGFFLDNHPPLIEESWERLFMVLRDTNTFCLENNMQLVVAIHPQRFQVQPPDWQETIDFYQLVESEFDLQKPNQLIYDFCEEFDVPLINPTNYFFEYYANEKESLYFPLGDMHWNAKGHQVYGDYLSNSTEILFKNVDLAH